LAVTRILIATLLCLSLPAHAQRFITVASTTSTEQSGLWGILAIAGGIAWLVAAFGLWSLQRWAWVFAMVVAGFALFEAFLWFLEYPGTGIGFSAAIMPLLIILYLNSKDIKSQFVDGYDDQA